METSSKARWLTAAVVLAACLPYLPTINDYFTQDDFGVVQLLASKPWGTFPQWFTMPWMEDIWAYTPDEIRPFVALSYQITAVPGAGRPELHHVFNILLHACNAVLVAAIARAAGGLSAAAAALAGLSFALFPVNAESVAWITGRVDSMPAFFYLAAFLCYVNWRRGLPMRMPLPRGDEGAALPPRAWYFTSAAIFFLALFSKQNTITMVATLAAWEVLVAPGCVGRSWRVVLPAWLPFALLTVGYLALRRALFGASLRGGVQSGDQVTAAVETVGRHVLRTVLGHDGPFAAWEPAAAVLLILGLTAFSIRNAQRLRLVLCLVAGWWVIGAAPVLVAGYESPRHVYLAAAAWAFLLGMTFESLQTATPARSRPVHGPLRVVLVTAVVAVYGVELAATVATWGTWSHVSKRAVAGVVGEAAAAPAGTMLVAGVPRKSWEWAAPFVLRPPYAPVNLSRRAVLITPMRLHCCGPTHWDSYTRARLNEWIRNGRSTPVVALYFAPTTGEISRLTDTERPELRDIMAALAGTDSWQSLDQAIVDLLEKVVRK